MNQEFVYKNNKITINDEELIYYESQKGYTKIKIDEIKKILDMKYYSPYFILELLDDLSTINRNSWYDSTEEKSYLLFFIIMLFEKM